MLISDFSTLNLAFTYFSIANKQSVIFSNQTLLMQQRLYDDQSSLRLILLGNLNFNMSLLCLYVLNSSTSEQAKNVRQMVLGEHHYHLTFFEIFRYGIILSKKPFQIGESL